ncbi:MAG: hypothetical protein ACP6IQ_11230 [Candidatus Njordarchaeia archaeon]
MLQIYFDESVKEKDEKLFKTLPHGSGIDYPWEIEDKGKYWKLTNSFHVMNEYGFYVGIADFSVIIDKKTKNDKYTYFRIHFHGKHSHYLANRYGLRDYLEDTIGYWISETFDKKS